MRNQYEPKIQWPRLITVRLKFGLPGMCMTHGYLPAAKQSPWYMENNCLDFTMEVPGQIMKVKAWPGEDFPSVPQEMKAAFRP